MHTTAAQTADALVSGRTYNARTFRLGNEDMEAPPAFVPTRLHVQHHKGRAVSVSPMDYDWAEMDPRQEAFLKDGVLRMVAEDYQLGVGIASLDG